MTPAKFLSFHKAQGRVISSSSSSSSSSSFHSGSGSRTCPPKRVCVECGSADLLLNEHEAIEACENCGLVQHRGSLTSTNEFLKDPEVLLESRGGLVRDRHGLPLLPREEHGTLGRDARHRRTVWSVVERAHALERLRAPQHRRPGANVQEGTRWVPPETTSAAHVAAVLLYLPLTRNLPSEAEVRVNLGSRRPLTTLETTLPKAEFPCGQCGTLQHTQKAARMHCRIRRHMDGIDGRAQSLKRRFC